jgi:hypothetical protein
MEMRSDVDWGIHILSALGALFDFAKALGVRPSELLRSVEEQVGWHDCSHTKLSASDHFQDKEVPVYESLVTECSPGIGMVVLIQ